MDIAAQVCVCPVWWAIWYALVETRCEVRFHGMVLGSLVLIVIWENEADASFEVSVGEYRFIFFVPNNDAIEWDHHHRQTDTLNRSSGTIVAL